jgi:(1->4)-alpha-D-glucan 1-alpha-D-glucosylmutase
MYLVPQHIPVSTYRLQFGRHLNFTAARKVASYLGELGIGDAYASPLFRARESSSHGYDVVDHRQFDPELGTEEDFQAFAEDLQQRRMGLMMDVVPNHMGIDDPNNVWWQDLLENGISSVYAKYFDVDWDPPKQELKQKVLLPILGDQYGRVLENQELKLVYDDQRFQIDYYGRRFPVAPRSWTDVLRLALEDVSAQLEPDHVDRMELESIILELENLPEQTETDPERVAQRYREKEVARRRLAMLLDNSVPVRRALERAIDEMNGRRGEPESFDRLERLLAQQAYRLCYWRVATDEINYRRFFDINELAAIRVEDPEVFQAVHELVFRFIERGWVTALRIDHVDGLLDPQQYFESLQAAFAQIRGHAQAAEDLTPPPGFYIAVEKILAYDESLCPNWPVAGTTGYDFLNLVNGLFVHRQGGWDLRSAYLRFLGENRRYADVVYESKKLILNVAMSSELHVLSGHLDRISEQHRFSRDFTRTSLRRALREVIACFPVYRTYIRPETNQVSDEDRRRVLAAMRIAKRRNPALSPSFFDFIASILLLEYPEGLSEEQIRERHDFVRKFQQVTGPVTAKGVEDTAFYRYYPLASLNEVGGEPSNVGVSCEQFHRANVERLAAWPFSMLATSTHDTKRGEDVRARLNVLSEIPQLWEQAIQRWQAANAQLRTEIDGAPAPDPNEEYLLYQTLVGTWPLEKLDDQKYAGYVERIVRYMDKALKEAKVNTSWLSPYQEYDEAVANFVNRVLDRGRESDFLADLDRFVREIADAGFLNSLSQTLLKIASPGVPDFYQGTEVWDFNLVDPDNRRPVDFQWRAETLSALKSRAETDLAGLTGELLAAWPDARLKLFLTWRSLQFRRQHDELFLRGNYVPLNVSGNRAEHVCALARERDGRWAVAVVPRLTIEAWREARPRGPGMASGTAAWPLAGWWSETWVRLPLQTPSEWRHIVSGAWVRSAATEGTDRLMAVEEIFASFPVALLEG